MSDRYRKKPVVVEAMWIDPDNGNKNPDGTEPLLDPNREAVAKVSGWMLGNGFQGFKVHGDGPFGFAIRTLEGTMIAEPGDWVIRGVQGEFYPIKDSIFRDTYEAVDDE